MNLKSFWPVGTSRLPQPVSFSNLQDFFGTRPNQDVEKGGQKWQFYPRQKIDSRILVSNQIKHGQTGAR
jgi:hypothetical protein